MASYDPYKRARHDQGIDAKIVVMGNTGVGKTSLLHRYVQNKFDPKNTTATTGAFFVTKKIDVNGHKVRLQLWDTAGQERFRSMAPMYYRGANAALILYDITNAPTFEAVRGWLEELKSNCSPELIIYIVGSKADLRSSRQVTEDFARLSLHNWFPPPKPPTPPPPPQQSSAFAYIRPRFTSLTSMRSLPFSPPSTRSPFVDPPSVVEHPSQAFTSLASASASSQRSGLQRSHTAAGNAAPRARANSLLNRSNTTTGAHHHQLPSPPRYGSRVVGRETPTYDLGDSSRSHSLDEENEDQANSSEEWGLSKGMELFEVSAKDDIGIQHLFQCLITAIIERKDSIERENELKKRDSVFLSSTPSWAAVADDEEATEKEKQPSGWSCCST